VRPDGRAPRALPPAPRDDYPGGPGHLPARRESNLPALREPPRRPGPPEGPPQPPAKPKKKKPWGMLVGVSLSLVLLVYGLVKVGFSARHSAPEFGLAMQSGPVKPFPVPAHLVGVATGTPFQDRVPAFEQVLGRRPGVVEYYTGFGGTQSFPSGLAHYLAGQQILSLIQINPEHVSLADIAAGKYDAYLRTYAAAVHDFRAPIAISFGHEMNGWWYSWGLPKTKPEVFVAAWRHIHNVFAAQHASNVIWVWTVSRNATKKGWPPLKSWWPGPQYVNWVGIDGYFRKPGQDFKYVFGDQFKSIRSFTDKPLLIAETAVGKTPDRPTQIANLFTSARKTKNLKGFIWFDLNAMEQWNIDHDTAAINAFHQAMRRFTR
jgi:mannan endo-1,4-beta-mannosidase